MSATAWQIKTFGLKNLQREDVPLPEPGPGQIRLALTTRSLNYRDLLMVDGSYDPRVPLPLVPCSDGIGVVDALGEGVGLSLGQRRVPVFAQGWLDGPPLAAHLRTTLGGPLPGTMQSHLVVNAAATVSVPGFLSDEAACTLPCAAVTAWHALQAAGVGPGSRVLTLGTGGVSLFALQLAKQLGAQVAITSSSDARLERAKQLGADLGVNYSTHPQWGRLVAEWAGEGVHAVIEVGGAGTLNQSLRACRVGGTIALIGVLAGGQGEVALVHALMRSIRIQGIMVGSRDHFGALLDHLAAHGFDPAIAGVHPYDEAPAAFEQLREGGAFGKVVVSG